MLTYEDRMRLFLCEFPKAKFAESVTNQNFDKAKEFFLSKVHVSTPSVSKDYIEEIATEFAEKEWVEKHGELKPVFKMHYIENKFRKEKVYYFKYSGYIDVCSKEYGYGLSKILKDSENKSDSMADYFEKSSCRIYETDPRYKDALGAYEKLGASRLKAKAKRIKSKITT